MKVTDEHSRSGAKSISESGSVSQRYGSPDPDQHQNVTDPQHCFWCMKLRYLYWRITDTVVKSFHNSKFNVAYRYVTVWYVIHFLLLLLSLNVRHLLAKQKKIYILSFPKFLDQMLVSFVLTGGVFKLSFLCIVRFICFIVGAEKGRSHLVSEVFCLCSSSRALLQPVLLPYLVNYGVLIGGFFLLRRLTIMTQITRRGMR